MAAQVKVFIGWSGPRSKAVALAMRDWLPQVLQSLEPWLSEAIDRGAQWFATIRNHLTASDYGLMCVTPENASEPWLLFEAGALAIRAGEGLACPYLLDMAPAALATPLGQLQAAAADHDGTLKVVETINKLLEPGVQLPEARLKKTFDTWWPELEQKLGEAREIEIEAAPVAERDESEKIDEILGIVRALQRAQGRDVDTIYPAGLGGAGGSFQTGLGGAGGSFQTGLGGAGGSFQTGLGGAGGPFNPATAFWPNPYGPSFVGIPANQGILTDPGLFERPQPKARDAATPPRKLKARRKAKKEE